VDARSPYYRAIEDRILACQVQIRVLQDEVQSLRALQSHPVVLPVMHWEWYSRDVDTVWSANEPDLSGDLLREVYRVQCAKSDHCGPGWPTGVSVGGAFISMDELAVMYPGAED
jgi:hypothetical protein